MFDIGLWELVLCAVVALLVLGPQRMPTAVRTVATWLHGVSTTLRALRREFEKELELDELKASLQGQAPRPGPTPPPSAPPAEVSAAIAALKAASPQSDTPIPPTNAAQPDLTETPQLSLPLTTPADIAAAIEALKAARPDTCPDQPAPRDPHHEP